jgi:alanine dehydrogenase
MIVGIPREMKEGEGRVALTPAGVETMVAHGHAVLVSRGAGLGSGIPDVDFVGAGARVVSGHEEVYAEADLVVKVLPPLTEERILCRPGQILFSFFHFAARRELTLGLAARGCVCIAYEAVRDARGRLPLLLPMSEVGGRMAVHQGAKYLERPMMGRGILLGGVPGVAPADVAILGAGVVGTEAAKIAAGLGARVTLLDADPDRLRSLARDLSGNVTTLHSDVDTIGRCCRNADLVIGAVLVPGEPAPKLVTRTTLERMKPGAVIVDVAVDQGGCFETTRPTTHGNPIFIEEGIVHYAVPNMPGAVGRTSTPGLTSATLPHALRIADLGWREACRQDPGLGHAVGIAEERITAKTAAALFGASWTPLGDIL